MFAGAQYRGAGAEQPGHSIGGNTDMRILVTGAGGFLGGAIVSRLLDSGAQVRAMGRTDKLGQLVKRVGGKADAVEWCTADVAATQAVVAAAEGCDAIIHLAALLTPDCKQQPITGALINVIGTLNVFEAAKRHGIGKVIYCSSGGVFGPEDSSVPFPLTHYGAFKLANEGSARAYWMDDGIASIGLRHFVIYGPGRETGLTAGPTLACRAAALGEPYTIELTGTIGLVYVDDVAASFAVAAQTSFRGAHVFNLPGEAVTITEIMEHIRRIVPDARIDCAGDALSMVSSTRNDYRNDLIDVPPPVCLEDGIRLTVDFYRKPVVAQ
jgi:UDP-glucose 4-epimerase